MRVEADRASYGGEQYHADIFRAGTWVCPLALTGAFPDRTAAQGELARRVQAWLNNYESRPHSSDSGFQVLL
jgi:hypothetical protein